MGMQPGDAELQMRRQVCVSAVRTCIRNKNSFFLFYSRFIIINLIRPKRYNKIQIGDLPFCCASQQMHSLAESHNQLSYEARVSRPKMTV